jgi:hypothetical protein
VRAALPALLLLLAGCTGAATPAADSTAVGTASRTLADDPSSVIDADRGSVVGIRLGMPLDTVRGILGAPLREGADLSDTAVRVQVFEYPMGSIRLRDSTGVIGFLCGGDQCATADGVGIGDSTDVLLGTYGPTPPRGPLEAPEAFDYRLGDRPCNLTFTLSTGRVTSIELSCAF